MFTRCDTTKVQIGNITMGGSDDIIIQSMCNTLTKDYQATINQIHQLDKVGCQMIRCSVLDQQDAKSLKIIKDNIHIQVLEFILIKICQ